MPGAGRNDRGMRVRRVAEAVFGATLLAVLAADPAAADTVILTNGKKLEDVVVSRDDGTVVVVNPWNSRHPDMTWEIPDKNRIPRDRVAEVVIADPPLVEYRRRASTPGLTADDHVALAELCGAQKWKEERERHLRLALALDPQHAAALEAYGGAAKWERTARGDPDVLPALRTLEREYLALSAPDELAAQLDRMREAGSKRPLELLERARRSAALGAGRRDQVPLTYRSADAPGATYCIYVPRGYDPLVPAPLVVGLHGGGRGGADATIVTGSGESAMNFYMDVAEEWGAIVVCPTARAAPWGARENEAWIDALVAEMGLLYHVDLNRVYLTGHSMGGFGAWHWGPARADVWAAIAPCAGGGGPNGVDGKGLPVYIFHGADDGIVGAGSDRSAAKSLASGKKPHDFVYTELDGVGHGFPDWVRRDIFRFFAGRWKDRGRKRATGPLSSFEQKVSKEEVAAFGDPSALPEEGDEDVGTKALVEALERGGGGGRDAADQLAATKDPKVAKSVAKLLRSRKATVDTRMLACRALGGIALPECVKPLEQALGDEDYRVVEAAAVALGQTAAAGVEDAVGGVERALRKLGERFDASIQGDGIAFREYEVRLGSLGEALAAMAPAKAADALLPVVSEVVVRGVFERSVALTIHGENDPRFRDNPSQARAALAARLRECLAAWADPRGADLLRAVAAAWKERQPRLAAEMEEAAKALGRGRRRRLRTPALTNSES